MQFFSRLAGLLALLVNLTAFSPCSFAQSAQGSLCQPDEGVLFSCRLENNPKIVSLCTSPKAEPFQSVTYRYGTAAKSELSYSATAENHNHFIGSVNPVSPNASVRQVWFENNGVKYIVTSCVGGDCPHNGGLIVFRGKQLVTSRACTLDSTQPWFSSKVVHFTSELQSSQSKTDLIQLHDYDNNVEVLYPSKRVN
jgi:hypothetical protein